MTATPSDPDIKPPRLVISSGRALEQEFAALKHHVEVYAQAPQPGCTYLVEKESWKAAPNHTHRAHRRRLWHQAMLLSRLIFANVYDHMWSTSRLLRATDSIVLYSHHALVRVACEGAAQIGYLLAPEIGYHGRLLRSAVLALADADAKVAAARDVAEVQAGLANAVDRPIHQRNDLLSRIERAGAIIHRNDKGKPIRLELADPSVVEPCKLNFTELMKKHYPARPATYRSTSGVVHSNPWMLNDTVTSSPFTPELMLEPDVPGIGAATLTAIDASIIVIEAYATYYGHDPASAVRKSKSRAQVVDVLLREWFTNPLDR